jgi:2-oxoglutarate dehydrogenase E2 component (dihydrolipoamide succinyltransferase)
MAIELKVPAVGESITEVVIGEWLKKEGDSVAADEIIVIIETDKVNVELPAPQAGVIGKILKGNGAEAKVGDVIGLLEPADGAAAKPAKKAADKKAKDVEPAAAPAAPVQEARVMPAAARLLAVSGTAAADVAASGPGGRLLKEDVQRHLDAKSATPTPAAAPLPAAPTPAAAFRQEEIVNMTPLRRRVAERLVEAQQNAAILTTFNEIDMSAVMELRKKYQEIFLAKYNIKLGFMSFFVKAAVEALKEVPQVNAEIRGHQIVFKNYYDIGVAVGGGKGLVVPIIRNAERLSFAEVEKTIGSLGARAKDGKLSLEDLQGGTFTISNGGIYGSLLSTPILNPPQSGILGLHKIEERPIALNGQVVIRPMMYVALSYDHRIIDGREAVTFLVRVKERIEDPSRILLEI